MRPAADAAGGCCCGGGDYAVAEYGVRQGGVGRRTSGREQRVQARAVQPAVSHLRDKEKHLLQRIPTLVLNFPQ